jgi:hypothetical protein
MVKTLESGAPDLSSEAGSLEKTNPTHSPGSPMRKFHTASPWFGEASTCLREKTSVGIPVPGESVILSGGIPVVLESVSAPKFHRDGYLGHHYWTVTVTLRRA